MTTSMQLFMSPLGVDLVATMLIQHGQRVTEHSALMMTPVNKFLNNQKMRDGPMPG
jgi:hypothetical protein